MRRHVLTGFRPPRPRLRGAPSTLETQQCVHTATQRAALWEAARLHRIRSALNEVDPTLPAAPPFGHAGYIFNNRLQDVLSEFVRCTRIGLPEFA